jgi:D-beta-D-heptose 7-phosphate kinase/D-beta-D-heptose 1-phosphate adenosyltransferase
MLIDDVQGRRVLVVGDVMLDHFVADRVDLVSPEAPALVLQVGQETSMLGGAGNVAANIASLGGEAILVGVVGDEPAAAQVAALIAAYGTSVVDALMSNPQTD